MTYNVILFDAAKEKERIDLLRQRNGSLDQLSKAATDYLTYKDPAITGDMTFQRYMQQRLSGAIGFSCFQNL